MKKTLVIIAAFAFAIAAQAELRITWGATGGFYFNATPGVGILGDGTGNSTAAYLVWDADGILGDINAGSYSVGGTIGGATILDAMTIAEDGVANDASQFDSYGWFDAGTHNDTYAAGYAFAIIFQDGDIGANDWYSYSEALALQDLTGSAFPQIIEMNFSGLSGDAIDVDPDGAGGFGVGQVVPEPATIGLFGLGALSAWIIRRNKQKAQEEA